MKTGRPLKDLTGQKFNRLTVVARAENGKRGTVRWLCKCDCGNSKVVQAGNLKIHKSCGCYKTEAQLGNKHGYKHGFVGQETYTIWIGIKTRCYDKNHRSYKYYGGRGITMSEEWRNSVDAFVQDMGERPAGLSIDRIDNNKGYYPGNCRWATGSEQQKNKRPYKWSKREN